MVLVRIADTAGHPAGRDRRVCGVRGAVQDKPARTALSVHPITQATLPRAAIWPGTPRPAGPCAAGFRAATSPRTSNKAQRVQRPNRAGAAAAH